GPLPVLMCDRNPVAQRLLGRALQLDVDRELDRVAWQEAPAREEAAARHPERVDADLGSARPSAQELVEGGLDTRLADLVGGVVDSLTLRVMLAPELLELLRRDLPDVAEDLRGERLVRVVAQERADDLDAREVEPMLVEVRDLVVCRTGLHRNRIRELVAMCVDVARELVHGDGEHCRQLLDL